MNVLIGILTVVHVLVAMALIGLVLMQKSQDQGVGAAFGGGVTETVFGAGTTTALVRMTIWCACIMLGTTLLLAILHTRRGGNESLMQKAIQSAPVSQGPVQPALPLALPEKSDAAPATAAPATPAPTTPAPTTPVEPAKTP
jgi:preprotein translocase subunit SecG